MNPTHTISRKPALALLASLAFVLLFPHSNALRAQEHSADVALRWSIIPGGGQIYNGQAWKIPIIYGAFAGVGYFVYDNHSHMKMFKDEYLYRLAHNDQPNLQAYASYPTSSIRSYYNTYNRYYQLSIIIGVGVYALNLVDAYVFGHLYDFKIDDDISLNLAPVFIPSPDGIIPSVGIGLRM